MNDTVFLTGISGYLGSCLARHLVAIGVHVHGLIRPSSDLSLLNGIGEHCVLHTFDGSIDGLATVLKITRPQTVYHFASLYRSQHTPEDVVSLMQSNVVFGAQLLEAMSIAQVPYLVNTGTIWQNYLGDAYRPAALYAATKQAFQDVVHYYAEAGHIRAMTLKLTDTYGPSDQRRKILNLLVRANPNSDPIPLTDGRQLLDLVHVVDVIRAYCIAAAALHDGGFNHRVRLVSSGEPKTLREIVAVFERVSGRTIQADWGRIPYRPREMFTSWQADPRLEGWSPSVPLEEGLRSMLR